MPYISTFEIKSFLSLYDTIQEEIDSVEDRIYLHMSKINTHIQSIEGIGMVSAATIIAEIEDITRFINPNKLLAFAGLEPRLYQSGTQEFKGRMNKKGSVVLRRVLMNCAESILIKNPSILQFLPPDSCISSSIASARKRWYQSSSCAYGSSVWACS